MIVSGNAEKKQKMRKILLLIPLILLDCSKSDLQDNFRKVMIDYQKTYPVKNPRNGNIYMYSVYFFKEKGDTIFTITRGGSGIPEYAVKYNYRFGVYSDEDLENFFVTDSFKLSSKLILNYKRNFPDSLIWKRESFPESITPLSTYKLKNGVPVHIKTDTIWNHWD